MAERRLATHACVAISTIALLVLPATSQAGSTLSRVPRGTSAKNFVDSSKQLRADAARQAAACEGDPATTAQCQAFRPTSTGGSETYDTDTVVVRYRPGRSAISEARSSGSTVVDRIGRSGAVLLEVPQGQDAASFASKLSADPDVDYAEPNFRLRSFGAPQTVDWGVRALKSEEAETNNAVTGDGAVVAVIDTGVDYTHEDLAANIAVNTLEDDGDGVFEPNGAGDNDGVDDDGNGYVDDVVGYDFSGRFFTSTEPDNDPMDVHGHGTHVSGIVAASDNGVGVRGMAPDAKILPVRVLDDGGGGFDSTIAEGIYYAADNGADVINMSLGGYGRSVLMREAVEYARDAGVTVVAAAGNAFFYSLPSFPAAFPDVLSVAAAADEDPSTDNEELTKVWFSDWGHADFLAPGVNVMSTTPDDTYDRFSGTSMAAPHVAGAAALVHEEIVDDGGVPTPRKIEQKLGSTAADVYFPGTDEVSGAGVPNADTATGAGAGQVQLYRDAYLLPSDGATESNVTVRVTDTDGIPIVGDSVSFSTDKGTVSPGAGITDANGEARTALTVDDAFGVATVTADPASQPAATVRVIVEDDRVRIDDAYLLPSSPDLGSGPKEGSIEEEPPSEPDQQGSVDQVIPMPGQEVVFRAYINQHDFGFGADKLSSLEWEVTDPSAAVVPELSGELDPITIPPSAATFFSPSFESEPMTIPFDAEAGEYTLTVTGTMEATGELTTFTKTLFIGETTPEILIVNHSLSFDVETFNLFVEHQKDSPLRRALQGSGRVVAVWDPDVHHGTPSAEVLRRFPVVIWLGGWFGDDSPLGTLEDYVGAGGNLVLSGEQYATAARLSSSTRYRDFVNASGLLTTYFPDDNHQQNPQRVTFANTSVDALDPLSGNYNLGAYDLNHTGESTAIFTDELKRYSAGGAETFAAYPTGTNATGGFESGTVKETDSSRLLALGFGIESINDTGSVQTLASVLEGIIGFFEPTLDVTGRSPGRVRSDGRSSFVITGTGFQGTGITKVLLGSREMKTFTVLDHGTIVVRIPKRFPRGSYPITVENPDGQIDVLAPGIRVVRP